MTCSKCGDPSFSVLCVHCSGERERPASHVMTETEWLERIRAASIKSGQLLEWLKTNSSKPGESVLMCMLAAASLTGTVKGLPSFEWYALTVNRLIEETRKSS